MKIGSLYPMVFLAAIFLSNPVLCEVIDRVAIVVNTEIITESEIDRALAPVYSQYRTTYQGDQLIKKLEESRQKIVEQMIEDKLILCEAKKQNIEVDDTQIEDRLNEMRGRFGSKENLEAALQQQRLTIKELKSRIREQLMTKAMVDRKIGGRIAITPVEVKNYYDSHKDEFAEAEERKISNILIKLKKDVDASKTLQLAREVARRLKSGGDFAALAQVYSEGPGAEGGGAMGYVKKGDLLPEVESVVFSLNEGQTSNMVQTSLGYHFFKVEEIKKARELPLSEVQREVEDSIYREKIKEKIKGWVEGLKKNAYIAFK